MDKKEEIMIVPEEELPEWARKPETLLALKHYENQVMWYYKATRQKRLFYRTTYVIAIFLGGITPVLVVMQALSPEDNRWWLTVFIALFPATAAILTSLNGFYQWREDYLRFAFTTEALRSEYIKFLTRTTSEYNKKLTPDKALDNFVRRIETFAIKEAEDWRAQQQQALDLGDHLDQAKQE